MTPHIEETAAIFAFILFYNRSDAEIAAVCHFGKWLFFLVRKGVKDIGLSIQSPAISLQAVMHILQKAFSKYALEIFPDWMNENGRNDFGNDRIRM